MRAFGAAIAAGADGIELDIFLTLDKVLVVTHDLSTKRLTGQKFNVRKTDFKTLRTLDFGKGEKIPTLAEVFTAFLKKSRIINVEIKSTGLRTDGIEKKLAELIRDFCAEEKILVSSFNPANLYRFRKLSPKTRIGYLIEPKLRATPVQTRIIHSLKPDTLNLHPQLALNPRTQVFFKMGLPLWLWGVDTKKEWRHWLKQGVAAFITNHPDRLGELLHSRTQLKTHD